MREIFEAINDYPWTTFFVFMMIILILEAIKECIHGDQPVENKETNNE